MDVESLQLTFAVVSDKSNCQWKSCDSVGHVLAKLGACDHDFALEAFGRDIIRKKGA